MLEDILSDPVYVCVVLLIVYVSFTLITSTRERSKIRRLGSFAPLVPNYLPYGLDVIWRHVKATAERHDLVFWDWILGHSLPHSKTIETYLGRQRYVFTADPENIKAVLATQFHDFGKGRTFHADFKDFLGDSIFTTDGDLWHASRQLIRPQFVKERMRDLEIFERHVQKVIAQLGGQGQEVDIASLFYRFTLDSSTDFLLGQSVGSLETPQVEFAEAFNEVQRIQNLIARTGPMNVLVPRRTFWPNLKKMNAFVQPFIDSVLSMNMHDLKEISNHSFLESMAAQGMRDPNVIRDQLVAVLLAGRDTTAGALSFLFLELARHPEVVMKLRREILEKVGRNMRPTFADLKEMVYLKNTVNEVLRLYPSIPFNLRSALHDTTLPTGGGPDGDQPIGILKGTPVVYSALYMQRRDNLHPKSPELPQPHDFSPERWEKWQPKPWQYIPFNGGPRICIGQQFALTQIAYTVVRILQRFRRVECFEIGDGPTFKCEIVLSPVEGVKVGFWEAVG